MPFVGEKPMLTMSSMLNLTTILFTIGIVKNPVMKVRANPTIGCLLMSERKTFVVKFDKNFTTERPPFAKKHI